MNAAKQEINQSTEGYYQEISEIQDEFMNPTIQSASLAVDIKFSDSLGRHVVATEDIEIGDIIAIEKPFCSVLVDAFTTHCHECFQLCYNPLPCSGCTQALFCSEDCMSTAEKYHTYECPILKTIIDMGLDKMKTIALRIALSVRSEYIEDLMRVDLNAGDIYRSDRYKEIHNLIGNTEMRTVSDLFCRATAAAVLYHLVKNSGVVFNNETDERNFREALLLHIQTAPCNFHEISETADNNGVFRPSEIGAGAYSFLSMINHSCDPNVVRQSHGKTLVLRAIRTIRKGEQCFDNYG